MDGTGDGDGRGDGPGSPVVPPSPASGEDDAFDATVELAHALLADQHPDLADRPISLVAAGWDNLLFRLGDDLALRLPRRPVAAPLIEHEQRWLPELAPRLPLPVPVPVRTGRPGHGFAWPWSVTPWLPGDPLLHAPPVDPVAAGRALGGFVAALRRPAPPDAPPNPYRGVPLDHRAPALEEACALLVDELDVAAVRACWRDHVDLPAWDGPPQWLHGDLHPLNVLVSDGRISAVIDFGDVTSGDPATDLFGAWATVPRAGRDAFRAAADVPDEATWHRGRAWALCMGLAYLSNRSPTNVLRPLGAATVQAVLDDWSQGGPPRR